MRVSWKWLNELIDLKIDPAELADRMTMAGVAVDTIERLDKGARGIVVGLIREITHHPQADKLFVCTVLTAPGQEKTIVTGAANVRPGQKVPVALPGSLLAGGRKIEATVIRGVESAGMLCSAEELGIDVDKLLTEDREGIYILDEDIPVGEDVVKLLGLDDEVLELDLTPNRADCLSMWNVACEAAALTGGKTRFPHIPESKEGAECAALTSVVIEEPALCARYVAKVIKDVRIGRSPLWLRHRLLAAGIRPINNIVDVTNYVMLEMGQPLHAFDYDALLENRIIVRRARPGEEMVSLDGQKRVLSPAMLVIADAARPVGLAGVMGGLDTEVTGKTKTILLEAAFFNGPGIRRTSQELGLRSEASLRFEKGVDLERVNLAADRAVQLMEEIGAGTGVAGHVDCFPAPERREPIRLRLDRVNKILGADLDEQTVERIITSLQINIIEKGDRHWLVVTPSYRRDLDKEIDLIEEIARLHGYDKIPTTLPFGATTQGVKTRRQRIREKIGTLMCAQGLYEIITFSFINPRHFDLLRIPANHSLREVLTVKNPLSEEQGVMRTTLLPGLLDTVKRNINRRNRNLSVSETGKIYLASGFSGGDALPEERWFLGVAATGKKEKSWAYPEMEYDFYYLKGVAENIFSGVGIKNFSVRATGELPWFHPGRSAVILANGREIGCIGEIHPLVLENYEIDQKTAAFLIDLDLLAEETSDTFNYQPLPRYPAVSRDLAVIIPEQIEAAEVVRAIEKGREELLKQVGCSTSGHQVEKGYKSMAFALTWQAEDRTLTDEEVNSLHQDILTDLAAWCGAKIRS